MKTKSSHSIASIAYASSIKFCIKLGNSSSETLEMLRAAMKKTAEKDDGRFGRPKTHRTYENVEKVKIRNSNINLLIF